MKLWFFSLPCWVKLNKGGRSRPLGNLLLGSLNSSKNGCEHASKGVIRTLGEYSSNLLANDIASGGVLGLNTLCHGCALIDGNLNSW